MKSLKDMTAEELRCPDRNGYGLTQHRRVIEELYSRLKQAITPNPDEIHIVWRVNDVYEMAEHLGKDHPTEEQARAILERMEEMGYAAGWQHIREIL